MTDRELLELAAKAAGISYEFVNEVCIGKRIGSDGRDWPWNPLTDDGDALRLAVKFEFNVQIGAVRVIIPDEFDRVFVSEDVGTDPYAATRRTIVKAAAEIGKAMKGETT